MLQVWQPLLTAHLVAVPVGLFCCFEWEALPRTRTPLSLPWADADTPLPLAGGAALLGGVLSLLWLFVAATSDPGVLLRSRDEEAKRYFEAHPQDDEYGQSTA